MRRNVAVRHAAMEPLDALRLLAGNDLDPTTIGEGPAGPEGARLGNNGELVVELGTYDRAVVRVTHSGKTRVILTRFEGFADADDESFRGVRSVIITGSLRSDLITLGDGLRFTTVRAGDGNDTIRGSSGNEAFFGGAGNDRIYAGGGDDALYGESGADYLVGGQGENTVWGGSGRDRLYGGQGRNSFNGGRGADYIQSTFGSDVVVKDNEDFVVS